MVRCLIALGSNEGPPEDSLAAAVAAIDGAAGLELVSFSPWLRTASVGGPEGQPDFLNGAAVVETELGAEAVLEELLEIERRLGRVRRVRWGQRTLDLDLLLYGEQEFSRGEVKVPHPRMSFRRFVLEPAVQIAGSMLHPPSGRTVGELLARLQNGPRYAAIAAPRAELAAWLAGDLHNQLGCPVAASETSDPKPEDEAAYRRAVHAVLKISNWESTPGLVECLSNESERLENEPPAAVSPFWLPATGAAGDGPEGGEFVEPSLVIAWLPAGEVQLSTASAGNDGFRSNLPAEAVHALLKQHARGPLLVIETAEPEEALHEAAAAVSAAWPSSPAGDHTADEPIEADD